MEPVLRASRSLKRLALVVSLGTLSLAATATSAGAAVTVGQTGTPTGSNCQVPVDRVQPTVTSGNSYASPVNGTITSWSTQAGPAAGAQTKLKIFSQVGNVFTALGQDGPRALVPNTLNTFAVPPGLAVKIGDLIGLNSFRAPPAFNNCSFPVTGESYLRTPAASDLANGQQAAFTTTVNNFRLNISAVIEPTNTITFGKLKRKPKKGIATLLVNLPNPGELTFGGNKVKVAAGATAARTVGAPGTIKVAIKAKKKKLKTLKGTGKVKVKPLFTFTPTGGTPSTQPRKLKLRKKL